MKSNSHHTAHNDIPNLINTHNKSDNGEEDGHGKIKVNLVAQDLSPLLEENEGEKDKYKTDEGQTAANDGDSVQDEQMDGVRNRMIRIIDDMSERREMIAMADDIIITSFLLTFRTAFMGPATSPLILSKVPKDTFTPITFLLDPEDYFHWGFQVPDLMVLECCL